MYLLINILNFLVMTKSELTYSKELFYSSNMSVEALEALEASLNNVGVTIPKNEMMFAINSLGGKYSFFYMEYATPQKSSLRKKDNPYLNTVKISKLSAASLPDYYSRAEKINNIEISESEKKGAWFKPITENCPVLVTDKKTESKIYFKFEKLHHARYTGYFCDGKEISYKELAQYYYAKSENKFGVDIRVINLDNVTKLHINGYKIDLQK